MARKTPKYAQDQFDTTLRGAKPLVGRSQNQKAYLKALHSDATMVFGVGPAGTGKTYLATAYAADQLVARKVERIIITRPTVAIEGENLGALPGDLNKKMGPWVSEIMSILIERLGAVNAKAMLADGRIEIAPFAFMRGRTFKSALVLSDETQNTTQAQAKALVTRIGEGTRYLFTGDLGQSDIVGASGLEQLLEMVYSFEMGFPVIEFTAADVERSETCRIWVEAYEKMRLSRVVQPMITRVA